MRYSCRERLDALPKGAKDLSFGNSVYTIRFESRTERPLFGHRYWFFLKDAVDDVPEYIVHWENFVNQYFTDNAALGTCTVLASDVHCAW